MQMGEVQNDARLRGETSAAGVRLRDAELTASQQLAAVQAERDRLRLEFEQYTSETLLSTSVICPYGAYGGHFRGY